MPGPEPQLPNVAPQVGGTPQLNAQLPASATAAGVLAQGTSELAQSASQASDMFANHALQMAAIDNKTAADSAYGQFLQSANQYNLNFQDTNKGMAAATNLPQAMKDLETQRAALGQGLPSPAAQVQYQQDSRRTLAGMTDDLARYASSERKTYILGQNKAVTDILLNDSVAHPDHLDGNFSKIEDQLATQGALLGWSHEEFLDNVTKVKSANIMDVVQGMVDNGQGTQAAAFYAAHKDSMTGADSIHTAGFLQRTNEPGQIAGLVDGIVSKVAPNAIAGNTQPFAASQPWNAGATAIRANPAQVISQLVGGQVKVTSGARTAAQNAAAGGSATSEHLSGNAWDFVPPQGMSLTQAAANVEASLHREGIPYDQIEIDSANGHVHVGFGPKARNEMIDQNGKSLGVKGTPQQMADPLTQLQTNLPQMLKDTDAAVDAQWPGQDNAARKDQAEQRLLSQVQRVKTAQDAQYSQTADRLYTAMADPGVDSVDALQRAYPGAASDLAALPQGGPIYNQLLRGLKTNANQVTPDKLTIRSQLDGLAATDPNKFVQMGPQGIMAMDIPPSWQQHYIDLQNETAKKLQKGTVLNQGINRALSLAPVAQSLQQLGITKGSDDYNEFTGSMMGEIENFESVHGRKPNDKDLMTIGNQLLSQHQDTMELPGGLFGVTWKQQGGPSFHVPDESKATITQQFQDHLKAKGIDPYPPSAATIAEIYWRTHAR